jgi:hypothetical protein
MLELYVAATINSRLSVDVGKYSRYYLKNSIY